MRAFLFFMGSATGGHSLPHMFWIFVEEKEKENIVKKTEKNIYKMKQKLKRIFI